MRRRKTRSEAIREDGRNVDSQGRVGHSKIRLLNREGVGLFAAAIVGVAWFADLNSPPDQPGRLVPGQRGVLITSFALSPSGGLAATTDTAGRLELRVVEDDGLFGIHLGFPGYPNAVAFSPGGRTLACGGSEPGVMLFDPEGQKDSQAIPVPIRQIKALTFSPDGKTLAVSTMESGRIVLWDLDRGRERMVLPGGSPGQRLAFSPDGASLATKGRDDPWISIWDLDTGRRRFRFDDGDGPSRTIAFAPDGTTVASASGFDRRIWLREMRSPGLCRKLPGHEFGTHGIAFSPDGTTLATAGGDGMIRLWTVATGQPITRLDGRTSQLHGVAFSSDGRTLAAAATFDNAIRLWRLQGLVKPESGLISLR